MFLIQSKTQWESLPLTILDTIQGGKHWNTKNLKLFPEICHQLWLWPVATSSTALLPIEDKQSAHVIFLSRQLLIRKPFNLDKKYGSLQTSFTSYHLWHFFHENEIINIWTGYTKLHVQLLYFHNLEIAMILRCFCEVEVYWVSPRMVCPWTFASMSMVHVNNLLKNLIGKTMRN